MDNQSLLESILTANVLLLEDQIRKKQLAKGIQRHGDYLKEAVSEIIKNTPTVLSLMNEHQHNQH